jgi:hypothetical protein
MTLEPFDAPRIVATYSANEVLASVRTGSFHMQTQSFSDGGGGGDWWWLLFAGGAYGFGNDINKNQ